MKAKDVLGARIVDVDQRRIRPRDYDQHMTYELLSIGLSNGTRLAFVALESDGDPYVHPIVVKRKKSR